MAEPEAIINEDVAFPEISIKLNEAKGRIEAKNTTTTELINRIDTLFNQIIQSLDRRLVSEDVKRTLIDSLNGYIRAAESGSPTEDQLQYILRKLQAIKTTLEEQGQGAQGEGGGRRTKKHKKSKSKGKGKGKAAKSKGRKTRRVRFGKAKKSRSRKHTSKRR